MGLRCGSRSTMFFYDFILEKVLDFWWVMIGKVVEDIV